METDEIPAIFSAWLRGRLTAREMSPADLARRMGVRNGTVSRWVTGKQRPDWAYCERIAAALGVRAETVLGAAGYLEPPEDVDPDDPVERLVVKLRRLRHLEEWQAQNIEVMLDVWLGWQRDGRPGESARAAPARDSARGR